MGYLRGRNEKGDSRGGEGAVTVPGMLCSHSVWSLWSSCAPAFLVSLAVLAQSGGHCRGRKDFLGCGPRRSGRSREEVRAVVSAPAAQARSSWDAFSEQMQGASLASPTPVLTIANLDDLPRASMAELVPHRLAE